MRRGRDYLQFNKQGVPTVENQTLPTNTVDHMTDREPPMVIREPSFEETVREVIREVAELRYLGKLEPFYEGQPVGAYKKIKRPKAPTKKEIAEYHRKRREWQREEMLSLRAKNDQIMREVLSR